MQISIFRDLQFKTVSDPVRLTRALSSFERVPLNSRPVRSHMYVLDTNVFNRLVDGSLDIDSLPSDGEFIATHIQIDEINATRNPERRQVLSQKFTEVGPRVVPTQSAVWGVSKWGRSKWGSGEAYEKLRGDLDKCNNAKPNNTQDALIGEVAVAKGYTLITADRDLAAVVQIHGGKCVLVET